MTAIATAMNPFPRDPVAKDSIENLPDFPYSRASIRAGELVKNYLEDFLSARKRQGIAIGIRGRFGAGKTHLVLRLKRDAEESADKSRPLQVHTTYIKLDTCDALQLYRKFASTLTHEKLRDRVARHLAGLLARGYSGEHAASGLEAIAVAEVQRYVIDDPQHVLKLVEMELLPNVRLREELRNELSDGGGIREDLVRAYSYVVDPKFGDAAVRWLRGVMLTDTERKDLGLAHAVIQDGPQAKEAIAFLLRAHAKADVAMILVLDEFERFALRGNVTERNLAVAMLKDLVEAFKQSGHCLIIAGVNEAFEKMPPDVFDRLRHEDVIDVALTNDEARQLLGAWSEASGHPLEELFEPTALEELRDAAQNVSRRMLNLAYLAFASANGGQITTDNVHAAVNQLGSDHGRLESLERQMREACSVRNLRVAKNCELGDTTFDYVVGDVRDPEVIVRITHAAYKVGEVDSAKSVADESEMLAREYPRSKFCVIIAGYSSNAVIEQLTRAAHRVIQFEEDRFASEWDACLAAPRPQPQDHTSNYTIVGWDAREVHAKLDDMRGERQAEYGKVVNRFAAISRSARLENADQTAARAKDKLDETFQAIQELIGEEELLALRVWADDGSAPVLTKATKLTRVLKLLDQQRAEVRRGEYLNDSLVDAGAISAVLAELEAQINADESVWTRAASKSPPDSLYLDVVDSVSEVRAMFRRRQAMLDRLVRLHRNRSPVGIWRFVPGSARVIGRVAPAMTVLLVMATAAFVGSVVFLALKTSQNWRALHEERVAAINYVEKGDALRSSGTIANADSLVASQLRLLRADIARKRKAAVIHIPAADSAMVPIRQSADSVERHAFVLSHAVRDSAHVAEAAVQIDRAEERANLLHQTLAVVSLGDILLEEARTYWLLFAVCLIPWAVFLARRLARLEIGPQKSGPAEQPEIAS